MARRTPRKNGLWHISAAIARDELDGLNQVPHDLIRYYMNEELTPLRNACRFRREFVPVVKAGRHEFFREPTSTERAEIARAEFDVCTRYEAWLKAQAAKKKKKALAKKGKGKQKVAKAGGKKNKTARAKLARR
jgi:hypothetical protein